MWLLISKKLQFDKEFQTCEACGSCNNNENLSLESEMWILLVLYVYNKINSCENHERAQEKVLSH